MKLEYMREFLELGRNLSFSETSEKLYLSQPTLSRHITSLEEELGCKLFERDTHLVKLTSTGEDAMTSFSKIIKEYDALLERLQQFRKGQIGSLSISMSYLAAEKYLSPITHEFQQLYPNVSFSYNAGQPHEVKDDIIRHKSDIGLFVTFKHASYARSSNPPFESILLQREPLYVRIPANHPLASREALHYKDLTGQTILFPRFDKDTSLFFKSVFQAHKISPAKTIPVNRVEDMKYQLIKHNGISIVMEHTCPKAGDSETVIIPLDETDITEILLIYFEDNTNPILEMFLNVAKRFAL